MKTSLKTKIGALLLATILVCGVGCKKSKVKTPVSTLTVLPKVALESAPTNTRLMALSITNPGSNPMRINAITASWTTQNVDDLQLKSVTLSVNSIAMTTRRLIGSPTLFPSLNVIIQPNQKQTLVFDLDEPFVNTATPPTPGLRKFSIVNIDYVDIVTANGGEILAKDFASVGLPLTASY